jgi:Zn-dependent protease with chaperone function
MRDLVLRLGVAIIILGLFGLLVSSGLPDTALIVIGFAVAIVAVGIGLRFRRDAPTDQDG